MVKHMITGILDYILKCLTYALALCPNGIDHMTINLFRNKLMLLVLLEIPFSTKAHALKQNKERNVGETFTGNFADLKLYGDMLCEKDLYDEGTENADRLMVHGGGGGTGPEADARQMVGKEALPVFSGKPGTYRE